jgi:indole-3-glycerol phosphate synthase/phosphoribosylanthranilate isomerase
VSANVEQLGLVAVQLHGSEDQHYIDTLRKQLPDSVQIWKALSVGDTLPARDLNHVDKYVFDNGQGGSGKRFDWSLLSGQTLDNVLLAGGLGADNCVEAAKTGCAGLDFNSGVESEPGKKTPIKWPRYSELYALIKEENHDDIIKPVFW